MNTNTPETTRLGKALEGQIDLAALVNKLERERDEARAALSGRTVSCSNCNESARTIAEMRETIQIIYDATECCADGAPDASDHNKLCLEIAATLKPFLK